MSWRWASHWSSGSREKGKTGVDDDNPRTAIIRLAYMVSMLPPNAVAEILRLPSQQLGHLVEAALLRAQKSEWHTTFLQASSGKPGLSWRRQTV